MRLILIEGAGSDDDLPHPGSLPLVVAALGSESGGPGPEAVDVVLDEADAVAVAAIVASNPVAAVSLATVLRASEGVPADRALALESSTYSMLQGGREFAAWRASTGVTEPVPVRDEGPVVGVDRDGSVLSITLDRPARHNAVTAQLRDELCAALGLALADDSVEFVRLAGNGPSFCSGGDLSEFGARADPSDAHLIRLSRSPARLLHTLARRLGPRLEVRIHGHALGGGIEMAAFAGQVIADPLVKVGLPEIGLGLIPGAGGTVSLPRRIGRQRTAWLGLTGYHLDASHALAWGLVDEIAAVACTSS